MKMGILNCFFLQFCSNHPKQFLKTAFLKAFGSQKKSRCWRFAPASGKVFCKLPLLTNPGLGGGFTGPSTCRIWTSNPPGGTADPSGVHDCKGGVNAMHFWAGGVRSPGGNAQRNPRAIPFRRAAAERPCLGAQRPCGEGLGFFPANGKW